MKLQNHVRAQRFVNPGEKTTLLTESLAPQPLGLEHSRQLEDSASDESTLVFTSWF